MEWGAAVTALVTLFITLVKWWQSRQPARNQEARHDEIQQGRADIADGDVDAVSARIDRLLADGQPLSDRQQSGPVTAERIRAVAGMADTGRGHGPNTGSSGSVPSN